ncbi:unnamed protein product [Schistosoma margrebowiei]|uniref:Transient receptor ion channel domain-containing protein n=1 Tax=Schistosoma margrebowiei TaxID=48269 RepID=A0A3P7WWC9_9TREM|nr:unnamed protein product [Schistosoma margrebowiei]
MILSANSFHIINNNGFTFLCLYAVHPPVYDSCLSHPPQSISFYQGYQLSMSDLKKATTASKQTAGCLFTNFEDVRLTDEERVYLNAAATGDIGIIRMSLEDTDESTDFNVNCVDYMGRNALHLAVDSENTEVMELLLDKLNFECIEEALLHAISKGHPKLVRVIIEHPNYQAGEDQIKRMDSRNAFFRTTEKSQFSPDITPLILSAHYNNHEMVQMFLSRNHTIDKPHSISCQCNDCQVRQDYDSLKRSRSRLNAYRALASPAYMALSSPDPIMTTFQLRQEMMKLAEIEKEFKKEYLMLVEKCMNFACEMMDLCRGTQEVEAVISDFLEDGTNIRDPLGRLRLAIRFEEKKTCNKNGKMKCAAHTEAGDLFRELLPERFGQMSHLQLSEVRPEDAIPWYPVINNKFISYYISQNNTAYIEFQFKYVDDNSHFETRISVACTRVTNIVPVIAIS